MIKIFPREDTLLSSRVLHFCTSKWFFHTRSSWSSTASSSKWPLANAAPAAINHLLERILFVSDLGNYLTLLVLGHSLHATCPIDRNWVVSSWASPTILKNDLLTPSFTALHRTWRASTNVSSSSRVVFSVLAVVGSVPRSFTEPKLYFPARNLLLFSRLYPLLFNIVCSNYLHLLNNLTSFVNSFTLLASFSMFSNISFSLSPLFCQPATRMG